MGRRVILWEAVQVCGQCGYGGFVFADDYGYGPVCNYCGHVHAMDVTNLDAGEVFYETHDGLLAVRAYDVAGVSA